MARLPHPLATHVVQPAPVHAIVDARTRPMPVGAWQKVAAAGWALALAAVLAACGGGGSTDATSTPVDQPPQESTDGLWRAPVGAMPADGNAVYLLHQPGTDPAQAKAYLYTATTAMLTVAAQDARVSVTIRGDESWFGEMQAPDGVVVLAPTLYDGLQRYPDHDPARGGLQWWGVMAVCEELAGWLAVDGTTTSDGRLVALEARFEQRCSTGDILRGQIRWRADDASRPPGPTPIPADAWQPAADATPASGNYVYLDSPQGEPAGRGVEVLHTPANAAIWTEQVGGYFAIHVRGDHYWDGEFRTMEVEPRLSVGYYGDLRRFPFHNPAKGGLIWGPPEHLCDAVSGWFIVDDVVYAPQGWLSAIELRFEQTCAGQTLPLRGKLRWAIDDPGIAPGPVLPVPDTLWVPVDPTPDTTHWHAASGAGDPIGHGLSFLLEPPAAGFTVQTNGAALRWQVAGPESWSGDFIVMDSLARIEPGYYPGLRRPGFHNPTHGALTVSKNGRACASLEGWVAVDHVLYVDAELRELDLRFEQFCEGAVDPLRGRLKWIAGEVVVDVQPTVSGPQAASRR